MRSRIGLLIGLAACSSATTQDAPKTSIRVSPHSATIYVGQLQSMGAATLDDAGDSTGVATVSWSSSAAAVASVAEDGIVTGLTPGVTTVVAATGAGSRDSSKITVIDQPCAGFARAPNLRGTATFVYAYTATLGEIEYAAHDGATMNFTATSQGFVVNNLVTWLGSATGSGAEHESRTDHSSNTVQTLTGSDSLLVSDLDESHVIIRVDLSTRTYSLEGNPYIDVTESPTPGDLGASWIGWFRTPAVPLDSTTHSVPLPTHSANWLETNYGRNSWYVPLGFSSDYFGEGAPDDGTAGTVSLNFSVAPAN